jgi:hypothetical protein
VNIETGLQSLQAIGASGNVCPLFRAMGPGGMVSSREHRWWASSEGERLCQTEGATGQTVARSCAR